jgi:transcriptional regulator with XRE-family HTH domain
LILKKSLMIVNRLITSDQIRAARALLKWSAEDLANEAGVGIATVRRFELDKGVPSGQVRILGALKATLEAGGIEFIGTPEDRPGVRLNK